MRSLKINGSANPSGWTETETYDFEHGAAFRATVEGNRPNIDAEVFRAGWYSGEKAISLGLIDTVS